MDYIDTSVILSYINPNDANHRAGRQLIGDSANMVISSITQLELKSVLARTTKLTEEEIEAYLQYVDEIGIEFKNTDLNRVFNRAIEITFNLKMNTLDVLHLAAAFEIGAGTLVSLDQDFESRSQEIRNLGIKLKTA